MLPVLFAASAMPEQYSFVGLMEAKAPSPPITRQLSENDTGPLLIASSNKFMSETNCNQNELVGRLSFNLPVTDISAGAK